MADDTDARRGAPAQDPLSADRRTLMVAAAAMVAFILIGVVSAAIVTRSACAALAPEEVALPAEGAEVEAVRAGLDAGGQSSLQALLQRQDLLGRAVAAARVDGADRLVPVDGGIVAVGDPTTLLDADGAPVHAVRTGGRLVSGGPGMFHLAVTNDVTGQTDAVLPLDARLQPGECLDTATVGTPFAFLVDGAGGELVLFRVEEDSDDPALELRHHDAGVRWTTELAVGFGTPGVLAERLDGVLGDALVVVGRRGHADEDAPVVQAFARADGAPRWALALDDLTVFAPAGDAPLRAEVLAVDDDLALLALSRDDATDQATVAAVAVADGTVRWTADLPGLVSPHRTVLAEDVLLAGAADGMVSVWRIDRSDGAVTALLTGDPEQPVTAVAAGAGPQVLVGRRGALDLLGGAPNEDASLELAWAVRDLLVTDGRLVVLLGSGRRAVAVTFASG